jgi:hypothetical protein
LIKEAKLKLDNEAKMKEEFAKRSAQFHFGDIVYVLRKAMKKAVKVSVDTNGVQRIQVSQNSVTSPGTLFLFF